MNYLKSLLANFIVVFFSAHIVRGVEVIDRTELPHVGGDLILAFGLGLLNSLIYPVLKLIGEVSGWKIGLVALILNFALYGLVKLLPLGISLASIEGYILVSAIAALGAFLSNFLEMKSSLSGKTDVDPS